MIESSQTVGKLFSAFVAASGQLRNAPKDSVNPHYRSRYADLATVLDTIRPVLAQHKLAILQMPCVIGEPGVTSLATRLVHESGEWIQTTVPLHQSKSDPQGIGSALTYARRYGLQSILGIAADDDDDGHQGSQQPKQQAQRPVHAGPIQNQPPAQQQQEAQQKPSKEAPKTIGELCSKMGRATPESGTQLFDWLCKIDSELRRLQPGYEPNDVIHAVGEFLKLSDYSANGFARTAEHAIGWKHAAEYVKHCEGAAK